MVEGTRRIITITMIMTGFRAFAVSYLYLNIPSGSGFAALDSGFIYS